MPFKIQPKFRLARSSYKKSYSKSAAASKIQKAWRARKKPSRLRVSSTRTAVTRAVSHALNNFSENKFCGYRTSCQKPVEKPIGSQPLSYMFYNTGEAMSSLPNYNPMNMFHFPLGDENFERNGQYMYLKDTMITMELQMLPNAPSDLPAGYQPEVDFRFMVVKANRKFDKLFKSKDPGSTLFLTPFNNDIGYDSPTLSTFELMNNLINKKNWLVYRDWKFTLATPALDYSAPTAPTGVVNNASQRCPTKKLIKLKLPTWKKTHFVNSEKPLENTPDNLDTQWLIIVQATYTSHCENDTKAPENYRLNMIGTTSARDN